MYFFGMKRLLCFIMLPLALSCVGKSDKPPVPRPPLVAKDTNLLQPEAPNPYAPVDLSPMDISYFPADYPVRKMTGQVEGDPVVRVVYSRPHRQGRRIFGSLLKYGIPWRLGANEATEIEFFRNVTIQGKRIAKGRYTLYAIPQQDQWTVVFNSNLFNWGLRTDTAHDIHRFDIPIQIIKQPVEYFSMAFQPAVNGAVLVMAWDTVEAQLVFQF